MEPILKSAATLILTYSAHYITTKAYNYVCVPDGWAGYLTGLITTGSPVCQAGVQIISNTQVSYSSMILMSVSRVFVDLILPVSDTSNNLAKVKPT